VIGVELCFYLFFALLSAMFFHFLCCYTIIARRQQSQAEISRNEYDDFAT